MSSLTSKAKQPATSTELTGGAGFTYEDTVVAYYLAALLREERAAGLNGIVKRCRSSRRARPSDGRHHRRVQRGWRHSARLSLQAKRKIQISAANTDFREILSRAMAARRHSRHFRPI